MNIENYFVSYELALDLRELGFNEKCLACYEANEHGNIYLDIDQYDEQTSNNLLLPLYDQVFDWLEEEHWIFFQIESHNIYNGFYFCLKNEDGIILHKDILFEKQQAKEAAIKEAIKIIKNK